MAENERDRIRDRVRDVRRLPIAAAAKRRQHVRSVILLAVGLRGQVIWVRAGRMNIPAITGLRFFAASMIVLWHSENFISPNEFYPFYLAGAVPLFFVLSGFVLSINAKKYRSWSDFLVARIARIWPAHVAATAFLFAIFYPYSFGLLHDLNGILKLGANLLLVQAWIPDIEVYWSYNAPSWSVSVEMFFYAVCPLCVAALSRGYIVRAAILTVITFALVNCIGYGVSDAQSAWLSSINPIACLPAFIIGVAAAMVRGRLPNYEVSYRTATAIQVAGVLSAAFANALFRQVSIPHLSLAGAEFLSHVGPAPFYAMLIISLAHYRGFVSKTLSHPWIVYGGEISFSIYLFHQLIFRWHADRASEFAGIPLWTQYALILMSTLIISAVSHRLIEITGRRLLLSLWSRRVAKMDPNPLGA